MSQTEFYPVLLNIVNSYTRHKVLQRRFAAILERSVHGEAICPPQFAALAIKFLGEEITAEFNQKFRSVLSTAAADRIITEHAELFSDAGYEKSFRVSLGRLPSLVNEMGDVIFKEKQNIGTVGAFLAFGGTFAAYCKQKEGLGLPAVEAVVQSAAKYLDDNLGSWLKTNGGLVRELDITCNLLS